MTLVGTREINNVEVEIHASKHGAWSIYMPPEKEDDKLGRSLATHPSLDAAINLARAEIKKRQVKVSVPFKTSEGDYGLAHGRHARSPDKILAQVDYKKVQVGYRELVFKPDTPEHVFERIEEIDEEASELRGERSVLVKTWGFDLNKALDEAIAKKQEEEE